MSFSDIKNYLLEHLPEWKAKGSIPIIDAVAIFDLIEQLSGTSRFWSEKHLIEWVENATIEVGSTLKFSEGFLSGTIEDRLRDTGVGVPS